MKTELIDVNETRKNARVEIASDVVVAEIARRARDYARKARIPGFRPGKAPAGVIKQRFKDQILHDIAQDLISRAVDDALRERGMEPIETPEIRDVTVEEGRPLTFTASFETVPSFEPGDYGTLSLHRRSTRIEEDAVDQALERLRERAARYDPVEGRTAEAGDTVVVDLKQEMAQPVPKGGDHVTRHTDVSVEVGAKENPPGLDDHLLGLDIGATKTFVLRHAVVEGEAEQAGSEISYTVNVKDLKRRRLPELDDEFAKDLGAFDTLAALRARVRQDLEHEARHAADSGLRGELMQQLAVRVPFELPPSLIERELDRRMEEFAHRLIEQRINPREAGIDWRAFREGQQGVAREAVAAALVIDEVARRERLDASDEEVEQEVARYGERTNRTPAAVGAELEKDGGLARVRAGLRRQKAIDFLMARATLTEDSSEPAARHVPPPNSDSP